jgi:hypothetical protein
MTSLSKTLMTLLAGYAVFRLGGDWREHQLARRLAQPLAKPRDEARWEGEGGALHGEAQTPAAPGSRH